VLTGSMNKTSIILTMSLVCILGLVYIVWSASGVSVSYLSEGLEVSSPSCVRIYDGTDYYYDVVLNVRNIGDTDASVVELYLDSKLVDSVEAPPKPFGVSTSFKPSILGEGREETIHLYVDSDYISTIMGRIKVSIRTASNKTYNLTANLV
jgi:hypothetical protein